MQTIIVTSGPIGAGKSEFIAAIERNYPAERVSTRKFILATTGCENERRALQMAGDQLDEKTSGSWVADAVDEAIKEGSSSEILLVDSARIPNQINELRRRFGSSVFHVHLTAEPEELERRYVSRSSDLKEFETYLEASNHGTEQKVPELEKIADLSLSTDHVDAESLARTATAWWGLKANEYDPKRLVDVIVGGQYGSEGKGNVCAHIAKNYEALVRIGGPNAGHCVAEPEYKYVQLPSGTGSNPKAKIFIGAGSTIWLPQILKEIGDHSLDGDRLHIDPQAMIIEDRDQEIEAGGLQNISTTGQGVGAAAARKILNRGNETWSVPVRLARDVEELKDYIQDVRLCLENLLESGARVLVEGTQGTMLSIHHGLYPHVTSRETTVAGCLSDAGIAPARLNRVIMVVRTYPIRVGGPSGWIGPELTYEELSRQSNIPIDELKETEKGTVSKKQRRIAKFDYGQLWRSVTMNGATEIAITFADYLGIENRDAKSFDELNENTRDFIQRIERVSGVPVTMVSKDFAVDGVLETETD
ncbi:adenylosuccinate synthetase [Ruegeria atlantica]|uniref:adenylosuccinate synthetase n=1 Tax=Ruegeria atlantica TaxID=81569 RepID=UPI00147C9681|nr:adenylosuccinate synthetase [Ruegeria atlantica]